MLEAFTNPKKVTRSRVPAANAPIDVPEGQPIINELKARLKRGRSIGSKREILQREKELRV